MTGSLRICTCRNIWEGGTVWGVLTVEGEHGGQCGDLLASANLAQRSCKRRKF